MKQKWSEFVTTMYTVGNSGMYDKCVEIDEKIRRYQNILRSVTDQPTIDGTKRLIADLEAQKAALHPTRDE
jgi:hypothetical protein